MMRYYLNEVFIIYILINLLDLSKILIINLYGLIASIPNKSNFNLVRIMCFLEINAIKALLLGLLFTAFEIGFLKGTILKYLSTFSFYLFIDIAYRFIRPESFKN